MPMSLLLALEKLAARTGNEHPARILARQPEPKLPQPYYWLKD